MRNQFEQHILKLLKAKHKAGHYDPAYHIATYHSGIKKGKYRSPETQLAWEWYQRGKEGNYETQ